jgi:hypothetical protein
LKLKQKAEPHTASCPKEIPNFSPAQILQGQSERWQMLCHRRTSSASASTSVVERSVEGATAVCQKNRFLTVFGWFHVLACSMALGPEIRQLAIQTDDFMCLIC